jgi:hypothetical protein
MVKKMKSGLSVRAPSTPVPMPQRIIHKPRGVREVYKPKKHMLLDSFIFSTVAFLILIVLIVSGLELLAITYLFGLMFVLLSMPFLIEKFPTIMEPFAIWCSYDKELEWE